ncbi:hypothetical protein D3C78_1327900 [compost metagenome]
MLAAIEVEVELAGQLVRGIRREWGLGGFFVDGLAFAVVAVDRCAGGEQHPFHTALAHGFADVQRADEIALVSAYGVVHRGLHRGHRRQVRHGAATGHGPGHQGGIGDVAFDQFDRRVVQRQVAALAGGQIIEDAHRMSLGEQGVGQVRTNETRAAGN